MNSDNNIKLRLVLPVYTTEAQLKGDFAAGFGGPPVEPPTIAIRNECNYKRSPINMTIVITKTKQSTENLESVHGMQDFVNRRMK